MMFVNHSLAAQCELAAGGTLAKQNALPHTGEGRLQKYQKTGNQNE